MTKTIQELNYEYYMEVDVSKYIGEWIAVCENKIVAHGKNLREVVAQAKKNSAGKKFLLARIPSEEAMIF